MEELLSAEDIMTQVKETLTEMSVDQQPFKYEDGRNWRPPPKEERGITKREQDPAAGGRPLFATGEQWTSQAAGSLGAVVSQFCGPLERMPGDSDTLQAHDTHAPHAAAMEEDPSEKMMI